MNIFEQAARQRIRFQFAGNLLTVEDLFQLPLSSEVGRPNLDAIAIALSVKVRTETESFIPNKAKKVEANVALALEVVTSIINTRVAENEAKTQRVALEANQARIKELIARKMEARDSELTIEELTAMLSA
jgi:hypothetical protein